MSNRSSASSKASAKESKVVRIKPQLRVIELKKKASKSTSKKSKQPKLSFEQIVLEHRENGRKLARSILRRWRVRIAAEEIDSIVDLTLCEAAARFNPEKGAAFMTFFYYHLRGNLVRHVTEATQATNLFLAFAQGIGLDMTYWTSEGDAELVASMPDISELGHRDVETPEERVLQQEVEEKCQAACEKLDHLEQEILARSFRDEETLVDIAKMLGYSRCHISRVKKAALERLEGILLELGIERPIDAPEPKKKVAKKKPTRKRGRRLKKKDTEESSNEERRAA